MFCRVPVTTVAQPYIDWVILRGAWYSQQFDCAVHQIVGYRYSSSTQRCIRILALRFYLLVRNIPTRQGALLPCDHGLGWMPFAKTMVGHQPIIPLSCILRVCPPLATLLCLGRPSWTPDYASSMCPTERLACETPHASTRHRPQSPDSAKAKSACLGLHRLQHAWVRVVQHLRSGGAKWATVEEVWGKRTSYAQA